MAQIALASWLLCRCAQLNFKIIFYGFGVDFIASLFSYFFNLKIVVVDRVVLLLCVSVFFCFKSMSYVLLTDVGECAFLVYLNLG